MNNDKVAIVTGCSSGLGEAFTRGLLGRGWRVMGVSRGACDGFGEGFEHVRGSVGSEATVDAAFAAAAGAGRLGLVVNCAGQGVFGEVGSYREAEIRAAIESNLLGLMLFSDRAVRALSADGGDIVNVMSSSAKKIRPAESVYSAVKWGAKTYTRTLREAVKAAKLPIRIFEVYPCGMRTRFWQDAVRPLSDGRAFPLPESIAAPVLQALHTASDVCQTEFNFERS